MSLLHQTIVEYLKDQHPEWYTTPGIQHNAIYILSKRMPGSHIEIITTADMLAADNSNYVRYTDYTDHK